MSRLIQIVGLPRGPLPTVLGIIAPQVEVTAETGGVHVVMSPYGHSIWRRIVRSVSDRVPASEAPSGAWSVWAIACPGDREQAERIFRWLGRYRIDEPDRVLGPYSIPRFAELAETRTDDDGQAMADLFAAGTVPWVMFGDEPAALRDEDYNPTDDEMVVE